MAAAISMDKKKARADEALELVGQLDPKQITVEELGLYMAGAKKEAVPEEV